MFNPYSNDTRVSKELNFRALTATASRHSTPSLYLRSSIVLRSLTISYTTVMAIMGIVQRGISCSAAYNYERRHGSTSVSAISIFRIVYIYIYIYIYIYSLSLSLSLSLFLSLLLCLAFIHTAHFLHCSRPLLSRGNRREPLAEE